MNMLQPRLGANLAVRTATSLLRPKALAAFVIYLGGSILLAGFHVLAQPATLHIGLGPDPSVMMWCMVWWPYAITHRLNPFISKIIWAPSGFNLTWSTTIPAVSLILAPVTFKFGPVVSYNLAAVLAPALNAWSAFALCRWLTGEFAPAIVGGLFYGFSPYEFGHVLGGHLSLTISFVAPLCLLLFGRLLERTITPYRFVLSFAALLVIQCLISNEVLATMTAFGGLAWLSAFVLSPVERRITLRAALSPLAAAYLLAAAIVSPFFYFALANGAIPREPLFPPSFFSADLIGFVVPTQLLLLAPHSPEALAAQSFGNIRENEFYLGLPLILLLGQFFWVRRSEPFVRILAVMLAIIVVAAIGPVLHVADHSVTRVPWAAAFDLPLLKQALPVRFASYGFLIAALIAAMSLAAPKLHFSNVLAAYGFAALLPNPWLLLSPVSYQQPAFFTKGLYRRVLRRGENIAVFPYGITGPSMLWQAESGMYFSMAGGYIGPTPEEFRRWPAVSAALFSLPLADSRRQLSSFLAAHHVQAVVAADGAGPLPASLGIKPIELGGVSVYRLPSRMVEAASDPGVEQLEQAAVQQWMGDLLEAGRRFLAAGQDLACLNPVRLHELGLLPDSKWQRTLDQVLAGTSHGFTTGLWTGPGPNGTVSAGLFASASAAAALGARYSDQAAGILYPYPLRFSGAAPHDGRINFLLMTMPATFVSKRKSLVPSASGKRRPAYTSQAAKAKLLGSDSQ